MFHWQRTIKKEISCRGIGLHSGLAVDLKIKPAPENHGIKFVRTDLPDSPCIPAIFKMVVDTSLATVLGRDGFIVSTIEHLMSCFSGMSIDNALIEISNYELPVLDGSALTYANMIKEVGIVEQKSPRFYFIIKSPIEISDGDKSVSVIPSDEAKLTCNIEFNHPLILKQSFTTSLSDEEGMKAFEREISKARTFGFFHELEYMRQFGLAKGGSLDNAVVLDKTSVLNEDGLRFPDEFVRHKTLDCIGDFSLLGMPILGHIVTNKSGHFFNHAFLTKFFEEKHAWETGTSKDIRELSSRNGDKVKVA